jgi:hypothetical protein
VPTTGRPRRPGSPRIRGVVACAALLAATQLMTACSSGPAEIDAPEMSTADQRSCRDLVAALPATLAGLEAHEVTGDTEYGAAWGDPAIVLTCGVGVPEEFDRFSACTEVSGVGWFVPPEQEQDQDSDVLLTAVGYTPRVSLFVPADQRGAPSAGALAALASPVRQHLTLQDDCV